MDRSAGQTVLPRYATYETIAFANRSASVDALIAVRCARSVMRLDRIDSAKNGHFSMTSAFDIFRWKGHQSRSSKTKGVVTSIGLHIRPAANAATDHQRREPAQSSNVIRKNSVLRTSLRSDK